jgi:tripartite-type tricarboxylate transporter receptor subunit TctC
LHRSDGDAVARLTRIDTIKGDIMKRLLRAIVRGGVTVVMLGVAAAAGAQNYPSRDITFIVPFAPGGSTDPVSRQFASQLEKILPGKINIENKPGGSATVGTSAVILSKPDGHTLGLGHNTALAYTPLINAGLPYKSPDDYQPIVKMVDLPLILVVRADAPWKTFEEFMAEAKKNPGKMRASVSGLGTNNALVLQQLNKAAGVKITLVPFTGGGAEAKVALLGGRVEANVGNGPTTLGDVQAGTVRVLAVFKKGKYDLFPDATPVADAGYDATLAAAYYVIAPKAMPKDVLDKLAAASMQVVRSEEFHKFAVSKGYVVDLKGPEEAKAELAQLRSTFTDLIKFADQK